MLKPGFGWTGDDFWTFMIPIHDQNYLCEVINIEIVEILENDIDITTSVPPAISISGMDGADYLINVDKTKY